PRMTDAHPDGALAGGALAGVRVLELAHVIAGPFCGQVLGDLGADVVKVEPPGAGDVLRQWGWGGDAGDSLWWRVTGRNKRSVTVDLRRPEGQRLVRRLAREADVVVENFRPGTLERWGLGYEELSAANLGLVLVRISGFGQDGPYAARAGYAAIGEAMGGLRALTGYPDRPPVRVGGSIGAPPARLMGAPAPPPPRRWGWGCPSAPPWPGLWAPSAPWPPSTPAGAPGGGRWSTPRSTSRCWPSPRRCVPSGRCAV